jgi:hypothetical protein
VVRGCSGHRLRVASLFPLRQDTPVPIAEHLRVDAKYKRGVDGLALAADLGRVLVQGVEVLHDVVERTLGDVFPFILIASFT